MIYTPSGTTMTRVKVFGFVPSIPSQDSVIDCDAPTVDVVGFKVEAPMYIAAEECGR